MNPDPNAPNILRESGKVTGITVSSQPVKSKGENQSQRKSVISITTSNVYKDES